MTLDKLRDFLRSKYPADVLMPTVPGTKRPRFAHSHDRWTWDKFDSSMATAGPGETSDVGVLLRDLCVVDVDDEDTARRLEARFPALFEAPLEKTSRGAHYWFERSPLAESRGYFDGAAQRETGVDFKSVCASGTSGYVVVAPSQGKRWVRPLWIHPPFEIPDDVLDAVAIAHTETMSTWLRFEDGVEIRANIETRFLAKVAYLSVLSDGDMITEDEPLSMPCASSAFESLLAFWRDGTLGRQGIQITRAHVLDLLRVGDMLGVSTWILRSLRSRAAAWIDAQECACECTHSNDKIVPVPQVVRHVRIEDPIHDRWLLPEAVPKWSPGEISCRERSSAEIEAALPDVVRGVLRKFPGRVALAGGAVLGMMCPLSAPGHDLDLFVIGLNEVEARAVVAEIERAIPTSRHVRTSHAVTAVDATSGSVIQVVLRIYESMEELLHGFDMAPSRAAIVFDADIDSFAARCTESWVAAVRHMAFALEFDRWGAVTVPRAFKYMHKGFSVLVPGHRVAARTAAARIELGWGETPSRGAIGLAQCESLIRITRRYRGPTTGRLSTRELTSVVRMYRGDSSYADVTKSRSGLFQAVIHLVIGRKGSNKKGGTHETDTWLRGHLSVFRPTPARVGDLVDLDRAATLILHEDPIRVKNDTESLKVDGADKVADVADVGESETVTHWWHVLLDNVRRAVHWVWFRVHVQQAE